MKEIMANMLMDEKRKILFTKNMVPEKKVYGERLRLIDDKEFREFKPINSKLAAAIIFL